MKMILDEFVDYANRVFKHKIDRTQYIEIQRAFHAGAYAMLMQFLALGDDSVTEEQSTEALEMWKQEHEDFLQLVKDGRA